jgi:hypothetical protein
MCIINFFVATADEWGLIGLINELKRLSRQYLRDQILYPPKDELLMGFCQSSLSKISASFLKLFKQCVKNNCRFVPGFGSRNIK